MKKINKSISAFVCANDKPAEGEEAASEVPSIGGIAGGWIFKKMIEAYENGIK